MANKEHRPLRFSRNRDKLQEVAATSPDHVLVVVGDVTNSGDIERLVKTAVEHFGKIDIVVPNAGIAKVVPFADCTEEAIN